MAEGCHEKPAVRQITFDDLDQCRTLTNMYYCIEGRILNGLL